MREELTNGKNNDFSWINILQLHIQEKNWKNKTCNYQVVPGLSTHVPRVTRGTHCLWASIVSSRGIHEVSSRGIHWSSIGISSFSWFWCRVQGNWLNKTCCIDTSPLKLWLKQLRVTLLSKSLTPNQKKEKRGNLAPTGWAKYNRMDD